MHDSSDTLDENEIDATFYEFWEKTLELRAHGRGASSVMAF